MTLLLPTSFTSKIPFSLAKGLGIGYHFNCVILIINFYYLIPTMLAKELLFVISQPLIYPINFPSLGYVPDFTRCSD